VILVVVGSSACGKRGDPLPPVRRAPQPVSDMHVAQRGDHIEISLVAPRAATDGSRLPVIDVEILRAPEKGAFEKVAQTASRRAAPGERLVEEERPLPPVGTVLRFAARARAKGVSTLTPIATITIGQTPPSPLALEVRSVTAGVALEWQAPAGVRVLEPVPPVASPAPSPAPSPAVVGPTGAEPSSVPPQPPVPSPAPIPLPGASPTAPVASPDGSAAPEVFPSPSAPGVSFFVYRRSEHGIYGPPLAAEPVAGTTYEDDTAAPGDSWCYAVRTVASTAPQIESEASNEQCLKVEDVSPPAAPAGVTARETQAGIEVVWSPSPEPDVKTFRVYRSAPNERARLVAEVPVATTTYLDAEAPEGVLVHYTLTAVDEAGNESPASPPAAALRP
jgi:hypothetical protein